MRIALVDNGSLEPSAHEGLRTAAARLAAKTGLPVDAVSWRHSDRIPARELGGTAARTLDPWVRAGLAQGEREFVLVPFFVSPQGAIASLLRRDLEALRADGPDFTCQITDGFDPSSDLAVIVTDRVHEALARRQLTRSAVVVVDHGGPSPASLAVRDQVAAEVSRALTFGPVAAASMEAPAASGRLAHGPLLADVLASPAFSSGDVVVAPLFLCPGRHAGPQGDLARIVREAQARAPGLRCHFADLVGSHPRAVEALASVLNDALALRLPS
jgi:sirohydrochlorin ferrochelatase